MARSLTLLSPPGQARPAAQVPARPRALRALACLLLFSTLTLASVAQPYAPTWESLDKRPVPQWYQDAKFGIFIHWGVYSVPGFRTKGQYAEWYENGLDSGDTAVIAYHKKQYGNLTYYQLADRFKAALFNPDEWAKLIEQSGARYVVLTSKHHDGFALWPSKEATRDWGFGWNAMDAGPHRDLVGDLFTAIRKTSVHAGLYYSLYEWYNPIWLKDRKRYVAEHMWPQMKDVITTYKPEVFWTDGEWDEPAETWKSQEFLAWLYNESPVKDKVVTYDRWGRGIRFKHGGVFTPEYQPDVNFADHYWEESRGMGYSYGYNRNEDAWDYNTAETIIGQLVDKVSGGGNFLLDIGPDGDGKIPPIMEERLQQIGAWMDVNHEAIYNTVRWRTPRQPGETAPPGATPTCYFTYNPKENNLFVILPHWPGASFVVKDLPIAAGTTVELLENHRSLEWTQQGKDLLIKFPAFDPGVIKGQYYYVVELKHTGDFAANPRVELTYPGSSLKPLITLTVKDSARIHYTLDGSQPTEESPLYTKPFVAQQSTTLAVRSFRTGALPSNTTTTPAGVYALMPAAHPSKIVPGLKVAQYELDPTSVADLEKTQPVRDTVSSHPGLSDLLRGENAGSLYTGYVLIPRDALYTWYLSVDDGGVLWIDGQLVVDHDGKHANTEKTGMIALKKGPHVFKLAYIQAGSDKALKLEYSANGVDRQEVPPSAWAHSSTQTPGPAQPQPQSPPPAPFFEEDNAPPAPVAPADSSAPPAQAAPAAPVPTHPDTSAPGHDRYQSTWESLSQYSTPDWFRDAKFGIFIHWGVYSVPAFGSEWYPRNMYDSTTPEYKHHVSTYGSPKDFGYKDFIPMFKADKFDAAKWVALFKKAGAKYVVPVAEHHDGFAMYKTTLSKWNAYEMGPKRDVLGELSAEIRKQGLIFGLSSHRIEHWFFFNQGRNFISDVLDPKYADFYGPARLESDDPSPEFMADWLMRCTELVDHYHPQLFWFDWWIEQPALDPYRKTFAAYYYNKGLEWNKGVVINYKYDKSFPTGVAVLDLERGKLDSVRRLPWQTDDAVGNESWGYAAGNTFKSAQYVVTNLIDIVSKNGNLLLNIGPRSDGTITDEETATLLGTGKWLDVNGEAIYGTRPWRIYGEGPTKSASGAFADQKEPFTAKDIRFTTKGSVLYAITLGTPHEKTAIGNLGLKANAGAIATIEMVGSTAQVKWTQKPEALIIEPSASYPADYAVVYKIGFK